MSDDAPLSGTDLVLFDDLGATAADLWSLVERVQHYHSHVVGQQWQAIDQVANDTRHRIMTQALEYAWDDLPTFIFTINFQDPTVECTVHPYGPLPGWFTRHLAAGNPPIMLFGHRHTDGSIGIESDAEGIWQPLVTCLALYEGRLTLHAVGSRRTLGWVVDGWATSDSPVLFA